jgi:hypothetical protein
MAMVVVRMISFGAMLIRKPVHLQDLGHSAFDPNAGAKTAEAHFNPKRTDTAAQTTHQYL